MALEAGECLCLAACAALVVPPDVLESAVAEVAARGIVPLPNLLVCTTHIHHAPCTIDILGCRRDEAFDRYGIDYRRIARAGVDRFFMETVGAGVSIGAESGFRADRRADYHFMVAFTKACIPEMPLLCLNSTGDVTANWDVLNHTPPVSERESLTLEHMYLQDRNGFRHASSGPLVCLADGITAPQWQ